MLCTKKNLIGADDFKSVWETNNADAFPKVETPEAPAPEQNAGTPKPHFVNPTPGAAPQKQPSLTDMMRAANETTGASVY